MMVYALTKIILFPLFKLFYRFRAEGQEHVPAGPVVLVANHQSYLDPIVVGLALSRQVYFVAKEELFQVPFFGWFIRQLHAFPLKRGGADRQALRTSLAHLKADRLVLIFPEGTRHRETGVSDGMPGAAFIAYKAGAPLVPTAIKNTEKVFPTGTRLPRFPRLSVSFGAPINLDKTRDKKVVIGEATDRLMGDIDDLLGEVSA